MNKPLTVQINETKEKIVNTINESALHPYILNTILKDLYTEMNNVLVSLSNDELKEYNSLSDDENVENNK